MSYHKTEIPPYPPIPCNQPRGYDDNSRYGNHVDTRRRVNDQSRYSTHNNVYHHPPLPHHPYNNHPSSTRPKVTTDYRSTPNNKIIPSSYNSGNKSDRNEGNAYIHVVS